jgi:hypothetical protein
MKQFNACEDEYKHQFFGSYIMFGGHMVANLDIRKCQSPETQKAIKAALDKAYFTEVKNLASHLYVSQLIKRNLRQKRHIYLAIKHAKDNYMFEDRALALDLHIGELLPMEKLPGR